MSNAQVKLAFLGLGVMGGPMAGHCVAAGHDVTAWNRSPSKALAWQREHGGKISDDARTAIAGADIVAMCLGDDPDVEEVVGRIASALRPGMIVVDHTTTSAMLARRLQEQLARQDVAFLDAPVSGGEAGAIKGALTIMVGGEDAALARARPALECYGANITHIGPSGAGQSAKMVNQICIAGVLQGLSEAIRFAEKEGVDLDRVMQAIGGGAAQSWQMTHRAGTMARRDFEFGFAVDWMRKDLRITLEAARANGASLPLTAMVDQYYARVQAGGGGRWDTSSLITVLDDEPITGYSRSQPATSSAK